MKFIIDKDLFLKYNPDSSEADFYDTMKILEEMKNTESTFTQTEVNDFVEKNGLELNQDSIDLFIASKKLEQN